MRTALLLGLFSSSCILADEPEPLVDVGVGWKSQFVDRGMVKNENDVLQGSLAVSAATRDGGEATIEAWGNLDLHDNTGDAWFPDGHSGELTETRLSGSYTREWKNNFFTLGIDNYNINNGSEFLMTPAFGARGPTTEAFLTASREIFWALEPIVTVHYDFDEVDDFYLEGGLWRSFPFKEKFLLAMGANVAWSGKDQSLWSYGVEEEGFADLRGELELSYQYDARTTITAMVAASTIIDDEIADWFDLVGIDDDNFWGGVGVHWGF